MLVVLFLLAAVKLPNVAIYQCGNPHAEHGRARAPMVTNNEVPHQHQLMLQDHDTTSCAKPRLDSYSTEPFDACSIIYLFLPVKS